MSILDADHCRPITLGPDDVEQLHWALGQIEDWLLHASDDSLEELGEFLNHLHPRASVLSLTDTLGYYCAELRRRAERAHR